MIDLTDKIVFIPRCGNCGRLILNEDEIRAGKTINLISSDLTEDPDVSRIFAAPTVSLSILICPRCKTSFEALVVPIAKQ